MAIKKKMQMGGEIGAFNKLKGAAKKKELEGYKNYGDGPGSGPSIDKTKKPAPKPKAMVGMKKAKSGGSFGMLSVKAGIDKNPKPTAADRIAGATGKAKMGKSVKKCRYGCK